MYFATAAEMAKLDDLAVGAGLQIRQMMELAGWHILPLLAIAQLPAPKYVAVVVGKGNKGGDALCAARHLVNHGYSVDVYMIETQISGEAQHHLDLLKKMAVPIHNYNDQEFSQYDMIIDGMIGYRLNGAPSEAYAKAINNINGATATTIAYDIPTGIEATEGKTPGEVVTADYTLMLALPKQALANDVASGLCGEVFLADIGIPAVLYDQISLNSRPEFTDYGLHPV